MHTEAADFLGGLRPVRNRSAVEVCANIVCACVGLLFTCIVPRPGELFAHKNIHLLIFFAFLYFCLFGKLEV